MYNDNNSGSEAFAQDSWAICCYVFLVSLLCEGIKVSNGVLMVSKPKQSYLNCIIHAYNYIYIHLLIYIISVGMDKDEYIWDVIMESFHCNRISFHSNGACVSANVDCDDL